MSTALSCNNVSAGYGGNAVVRGLDLELQAGNVLLLLGPNGAGKTTALLTLAGFLPRLGGDIGLLGSPVHRAEPVRLAQQGLVLVPDDRSLFGSLTTEENLLLARRQGGREIDEMLELFPALQRRLRVAARLLSGGEQQMLAMARGLIQRPKVLLVDEMSMGLAPLIVESLFDIIRRIASEDDVAIILVEQHVRMGLEIADHAMVLVHGELTLTAPAHELRADVMPLERAYLGERVGSAHGTPTA
jgi:branched-chain amino acid transport system ATP-binding protein